MKTLALLACLSIAAPSGCATVAASLPTVIAYSQDAMIILDQIQRFVEPFLSRDADLRAKVDKAAARARSALSLALRAASGTDKLNQAQVDAAFVDFKVAYLDLMALVGPLGVHQSTDRLATLSAAPGGGLIVPEPLALVRR